MLLASITIDLLLCHECASHNFFYLLSFVTALKHKEAHKNGNFKEKCWASTKTAMEHTWLSNKSTDLKNKHMSCIIYLLHYNLDF